MTTRSAPRTRPILLMLGGLVLAFGVVVSAVGGADGGGGLFVLAAVGLVLAGFVYALYRLYRYNGRFAIALGGLLLLAALVLVAALTPRLLTSFRQQQATRFIEQLGGRCDYDFSDEPGDWFRTPNGLLLPDWARRWLGDDFFGNVTMATPGESFDDDGVSVLADLQQLTHLNLYASQITDEGLAELAGLVNVSELYLQETRITNDGLLELARIPKLRYVVVVNTQVDLEGIQQFKKLRPKCIVLCGTPGRVVRK